MTPRLILLTGPAADDVAQVFWDGTQSGLPSGCRNTLAPKPAPPDPTPEEEEIMPTPDVAACECGCGEPALPGKRFATTTCGKRFAGRLCNGVPRKSKAGKVEPKPCECGCGKLAAPGNRFAGRQCSKRAWRERQWRENPAAASAPAPSPSPHRPPAVSAPSLHRPPAVPAPAPTTARQVLDYLLGLAPEQREALADLVAAQEACARLGVAL